MKLLDCLLVGGVGAMLLATAATAEKAAPEQGVVKNPKQEMLCRRETETGSLVKAKRTCHTREQWAFIDTENQRLGRDLVDDNRSKPGGSN